MFIKYNTAGCKEQVRDLLRTRLSLKSSIRRHKKLSKLHFDKIKEIETISLPEIEKQLNFYLDKASPNGKV